MTSRSKQIMLLATADDCETLQRLTLPKYESTKGISVDYRESAISNWSLEHDLINNTPNCRVGSEVDIRSTIECTGSDNTVEEKSGEENTSSFEITPDNIEIIGVANGSLSDEDVTSRELQLDMKLSTFFKKPLKHVSHNTSNSMTDSSLGHDTESITSGSEYLPGRTSDSDSSRSTSFTISKDTINWAMGSKRSVGLQVYPQDGNIKQDITHNKKSGDVCSETEFTPDNINYKVHQNEIRIDSIQVKAAQPICIKRVRDKAHCCYFCQKMVIYMARHLEVCHTKEIEVGQLLIYPKGSKIRKDGFANLSRVGDFYYNTQILGLKQGELILLRRPTQNELKTVTYKDYGPCPHCLGFMLKKHIWRHIKHNCIIKTTETEDVSNLGSCFNRDVIAESDAIILNASAKQFSEDFLYNIMSKMRNDEIAQCCKESDLIMRFGALQFEKYSTSQSELIRQSMRQLARLTIKLQELSGSRKCLSDFLVPEKFDSIIQATKLLCISHTSENQRTTFEIPSLALKLGHALRKCVAIERGAALREFNNKKNKTRLAFLALMDLEWNARISSNALATLYTRKINATELLPLTRDLVKLSEYLDRNILFYMKKLTLNPTADGWHQLAILILSRIILFNKRRSGEASKILIVQYNSRPEWTSQTTEELKNSLSPLERQLADRLTLVEVVGKRGKKVPIILTPETKSGIDRLIEYRLNCGIDSNNPYVFAATKTLNGHLRGHICISKMCSNANLESPKTITGTKLRKYVATVCQIFNLTPNEYDWLARHLGHDIRVHREFYRLHENAVELTKVSRLLLAVDKGEANQFCGKKLGEIEISDLPNIEEELEDEETHSVSEEDEDETVEEFIPAKEVVQRKLTKDVDARKPKKSSKKRYWSLEEKTAVYSFFKINIRNGTVPTKESAENCLEKHSDVLMNRSWRDIKYCVYNQIQSVKKISKSK